MSTFRKGPIIALWRAVHEALEGWASNGRTTWLSIDLSTVVWNIYARSVHSKASGVLIF